MSFLKKALLTAAVAAVGLAGSLVAPTSASATGLDGVGSSAMVGTLTMSPSSVVNGGVSAGTLSYSSISGDTFWGGYSGACGLASGMIAGSILVNGRVLTIESTFEMTGSVVTGLGHYADWGRNGEGGNLAFAGSIADPEVPGASCALGTKSDFTLVIEAVWFI